MSYKSPTFLLTVLVILSFALPVFPLLINETASADDTVEEGADLHVNMKEGETLSSETKSDSNETGVTQKVFADYDDFGAGRTNARWVDVGTWTSTSRDNDMSLEEGSSSMEFNLWYSIAGETNDAQCAFRFILILDGEEIVYVEGMDESPAADQVVEYWTLQNPNASYVIPATSTLELKIRYKAFEDCDIYYDSTLQDSGFWMTSNFCKVFGAEATTSQVSIEVYDAWGADWDEVVHFLVVDIDGAEPEEEYRVEEGKTRKYNGTDCKTTIITWVLGFKAEKGALVKVNLKYTVGDYNDPGLKINFEVGTSGGSLADDDDDDSDSGIMIYVALVAVVAAGAIGGVFFMKNRDEGGDEEEEGSVENEEYEKEDEIEYE